jgi:sulfite reductase alpha subunit-like flavoprotein
MNYIYVTYGTQTGNSEAIASRISKELKQNYNKENTLMVLNSFLKEIQKFPEHKDNTYNVIIVCSTTGNGDSPANSDNFIRWIKRKTHSGDTLSNVRYAVLGLGDSNYTKYQYIPRLIDDQFKKLGASKLYKRGEADDAYGLEAVVEPWIEGLYKELATLGDTGLNSTDVTEPSINVGTINEVYTNAKIVGKSRLSGKNAEKEIFSIKIEAAARGYSSYQAGASISIIPPNTDWEKLYDVITVKEKYLQIDKTHNFTVYSDFFEKYPHFKNFIGKGFLTLDEIFKYVIDFNSVLHKSQADNVKDLLKNKIHNVEFLNKYETLLSKYTELIFKNKVNLYDILMSLKNSKINLNLSLSEMLEKFPIKRPRDYSLVSSSESDTMEIVFSLVKEKINRNFPKDLNIPGFSKGDFIYRGLCTNFLKNAAIGEEILLTGMTNIFQFPNDKPIVYICNGTGITPCISYLKSRKEGKVPNTHKLSIFTGFRNASVDKNETIFEDFITTTVNSLNKQSELINYHRCLSVSTDNEEEEIGIWRNCRLNTYYVQDMILEHSEELYRLLFEDNGKIKLNIGCLMICGDVVKLYDECVENIIYILGSRNGYSREHSLNLIEEMKLSDRIVIEKWI